MKFLFIFLPLFLFSQDFITSLEYGEMLYKNPRGIGCIKCHGKNAQGKLIAIYKDKNGKVNKISAPNITNVSFEVFKNRLKYSKVLRDGKFKTLYISIMPKYDYLTDDEIKTLYGYIQHLRKK